jgi:hypothetical protein
MMIRMFNELKEELREHTKTTQRISRQHRFKNLRRHKNN